MNTPSAVLDGTRSPEFGSPSLHALLRRWLPAQRWYAGRGRIAAVTVVAATELNPECHHLIIRVGEDSGENDAYYQLFLGAAVDPAPRLRQYVLGRVSAPGGRDLLLYDAVHDQRVAVLLLDRIRRGGRSGHLRFESFPRVAVPAGLTPRVIGTEQSNTSIVYGDTLILKLFRRIQPGINPDLEVPTALARSGYARTPAPTAWFFSTSPFWGTLGMVQPFIPRATDGWTLALRSASARGDFVEQAHDVGRTTAELHTALARAFPVRAPEPHHLPRLTAEMTARLLRGAEAIPALRRHVAGLRTIYAAASDGSDLPLQRLHGDLHLGQVLQAQGRWHVVDFEGEPAQPMAERRSARSPLRDVVGMLRSFDYAGHMGAPEDVEWAERCRTAFRAGYGEAGGFDPDAVPAVLRAYEADRAVYEVLYEAAHRPEWIDVPLRAVSRLVATAAR